MYTKSHINFLKRYNGSSTSFLIKQFGITYEAARKILKEIVDHYENIYFVNENQIRMKGYDLEKKLSNRKKYKKITITKRKSKWKDVTKP